MSSYALTKGAEEDWGGIAKYTLDHFDKEQLSKYTVSLAACIQRLAKEEGRFRDIDVDHLVIRMKLCQKHYVFATVTTGQPLIILAILHERMDWMQRLKDRLTKG